MTGWHACGGRPPMRPTRRDASHAIARDHLSFATRSLFDRRVAASSEPLADARLVARCRAGEQDAWCELVERFSRYVYAICTQGYGLAQSDAEDVFQDVFARTYEQLYRLRDDRAIRPWIAQLTRRSCIDRLRTSQRDERRAAQLEPPVPDETLARLDTALTVQMALERVSPSCAEILDRFFCCDQSYEQIAAALAVPQGTVASRISRCLG